MTRSISIIIPAYNEEQRLPATLDRVYGYLAAGGWVFAEVLLVDDGSRDRTAAIAESFRERLPALRVLRNPGNRGKGYSVKHGMLSARGEWSLFSDADLSAPIGELETLWKRAEESDADVVIGSRALDRSLIGVHQSAFRELAGRVFNVGVRLVAGLPFSDTQCGFKLFRSTAAREIFRRQQLERFGFDVETLFIARRLGYRVLEAPVRWNDVAGTKVSAFSGLNAFLDPFRVRIHQIRGRYR